MKDETKSYIKCAVKNRFTLCGFIFSGFSPVLLATLVVLDQHFFSSLGISIFILFCGLILLWFTNRGLETYRAYKRTIRHIKEYGAIDKRYESKISVEYCDRVGMEMAEKEMSLDKSERVASCC